MNDAAASAMGGDGPDAAMLRMEKLLADALQPIEPPERLSERLYTTFSAVTQAAADELSDWADELSDSEREALRDPRNWVRPVVAMTAGGIATGALVVLEARRRHRQRGGGIKGVTRGIRDRLQ